MRIRRLEEAGKRAWVRRARGGGYREWRWRWPGGQVQGEGQGAGLTGMNIHLHSYHRPLYSCSVKFYFVDVNTMPSALVSRTRVTMGFLESLAFFVFPFYLLAGSSTQG